MEQIHEEIVHEKLHVEESMQSGLDARMEQHGPCTLVPLKVHKKMKDQPNLSTRFLNWRLEKSPQISKKARNNKNGLNRPEKVNKDKMKIKLAESHTLVFSDSTFVHFLIEKVSLKNLEREAMECEIIHRMGIMQREQWEAFEVEKIMKEGMAKQMALSSSNNPNLF
ncbi:hypothetical protein HN51_008515 [Arachis hypogaea]